MMPSPTKSMCIAIKSHQLPLGLTNAQATVSEKDTGNVKLIPEQSCGNK